MRIIFKVLTTLFALVLLTIPLPAFAHGQVLSSNPTPNSVTTKVPKEISINFDGQLIRIKAAKPNYIKAFDSSGKQVAKRDSRVQGSKVTVTLKRNVAPGIIKVKYRIVSSDGHPVTGRYFFTLKAKIT